jgi:ABC-type Mn2+/Zn2+ transport system permease subunit
MLYADTVGRRLAIGWTMGTIVSAIGVYLSLVLDLPTGANDCLHLRHRARW